MTEILIAYLVGKAISALGLTTLALLEATRHWGKDCGGLRSICCVHRHVS